MKVVKKGYEGPRVIDTATFILKARWQHGYKYDYSKVDYVKASRKVEIVCPEHGSFYQRPTCHNNNGAGCPSCKFEKLRELYSQDTVSFIKISKNVHGNKYDYSNTKYTGDKNKVVIICPKHGEFTQMAGSHKAGKGCVSCGFESTSASCRSNKENFIANAIEVHGDRFDYSLVDYVNTDTKVVVICKDHGKFEITPYHHVNRRQRGCPECRYILSDTEQFVEKAKDVHGEFYDYSKSEYVRANDPVEIICPRHGSFWQTPFVHYYSRSGCPTCAEDRKGWRHSIYFSKEEESSLYIIKFINEKDRTSFIKIGLSVDPERRMKELSRESGCNTILLYKLTDVGKIVWEIERYILYRSNLKKFKPPYKFKGDTECLESGQTKEILKIIDDFYNQGDLYV